MANPIPFNPEAMTVSELIKVATDLRSLFDVADRQEGGTDRLTLEVRELKEFWEKRASAKSNNPGEVRNSGEQNENQN